MMRKMMLLGCVLLALPVLGQTTLNWSRRHFSQPNVFEVV